MIELEKDLLKLLEKSENFSIDDLTNKKEEIISVCDKMKEFLYANTDIALGLSAIQVGFNMPIFMIIHENELRTFINPSYTPVFKNSISKKEISIEGCLSFPEIECAISRAKSIYIYGYELIDNEIVKLKPSVILKDIWAIVFQHEYDHLQGKNILQTAEKLGNVSLKENQKKIYALPDIDDYIIDGEEKTIFKKIDYKLNPENYYVVGIKTYKKTES